VIGCSSAISPSGSASHATSSTGAYISSGFYYASPVESTGKSSFFGFYDSFSCSLR